jgi:predicted nucleic acid-binding protein
MTKQKVLILLDADVIIHLFKADKLSVLPQLYKNRLVILDIVLDELRNNRSIRNYIDNFFLFAGVDELKFPTTSNPDLFSDFIKLKDRIDGQGERACVVYCKHYKHIIASSNTSDILNFCIENSIAFLTTLDIFAIALKNGIFSNNDVADSIHMILKQGSYLCCNSIDEHLKRHFDPVKYSY